jgi:H+/Cl- antiporter ClcA
MCTWKHPRTLHRSNDPRLFLFTRLCLLLLLQVVLHLYQEALEKVPFFRGQHPQFITSVVTFLKLEYYAPVSAFTSGMGCWRWWLWWLLLLLLLLLLLRLSSLQHSGMLEVFIMKSSMRCCLGHNKDARAAVLAVCRATLWYGRVTWAQRCTLWERVH